MGITVGYQPNFDNMAGVAYDSGRGQFLQKQDRHNFDVRQFDETMGLRERDLGEKRRQFDMGQQYRYDALQQSDRAQQRQLGQNSYQFDQQMDFRRDSAEESLAANQRRDADQQNFQERQFGRQERNDLQGIKEKQLQRNYSTSLLAAQNLENMRGKLSEEQFNQAKQQWQNQYGQLHGGEYPFDVPFQKDAPQFTVDTARAALVGSFGESFPVGGEQWYGRENNGSWEWFPQALAPGQAWEARESKRADFEKAEAANANKIDVEERKAQATNATTQATNTQSYLKEQQKQDALRQKYVIDTFGTMRGEDNLGMGGKRVSKEKAIEEANRLYPMPNSAAYGLPSQPELPPTDYGGNSSYGHEDIHPMTPPSAQQTAPPAQSADAQPETPLAEPPPMPPLEEMPHVGTPGGVETAVGSILSYKRSGYWRITTRDGKFIAYSDGTQVYLQPLPSE